MERHATEHLGTREPAEPEGSRWIEDVPGPAEDVVDRVKRSALRVHRSLGAGFKETVYQRCLAHAMARDGLAFVEEPPLTVEFEGLVIRNAGAPDFLVEDLVIVEIKAAERLPPVAAAQVINYLKASGRPLGLLINFNAPLLRRAMDRFVHPDLLKRKKDPSP